MAQESWRPTRALQTITAWPPFPPQSQRPCQHCFCQNTTVGQVRHRVCCMCGHREAIRNTWGQPIRLG